MVMVFDRFKRANGLDITIKFRLVSLKYVNANKKLNFKSETIGN